MTTPQLRQAIAQRGGLVNGSGVARLLGVSRAGAHGIVRRDDFPDPVTWVGARPVWAANDVRTWRDQHRPG